MTDGLALPHCAKGSAIVTADTLRVREQPVNGATVGLLARDESVTVWAIADGWAIVQNGAGLTGWVAVAYLRVGTLTP